VVVRLDFQMFTANFSDRFVLFLSLLDTSCLSPLFKFEIHLTYCEAKLLGRVNC